MPSGQATAEEGVPAPAPLAALEGLAGLEPTWATLVEGAPLLLCRAVAALEPPPVSRSVWRQPPNRASENAAKSAEISDDTTASSSMGAP
jgi:hypothetical protein